MNNKELTKKVECQEKKLDELIELIRELVKSKENDMICFKLIDELFKAHNEIILSNQNRIDVLITNFCK